MCSLTQLTCVSQLWLSTTTQSSVHTHTTSLHVRVVGDQEAIHVLIRVRHRSQFSPRVYLSLCVSHNNAAFVQTTLYLVLRLIVLVLISGLLHPINFGLSQFPCHHDNRGLDAIVCGL